MTRLPLVMTLLVRDEADIVAHNIEYHLSQGVDHVIATDNASIDGTREILEAYAAAGVLTLLDEPSHEYRQDVWATSMARLARERFGPCWIISNDADEFWTAPSEDLTAALSTPGPAMIQCARRNMFTAHEWLGFVPWYEELVFTPASPPPLPRLEDPLNDPIEWPYFYHRLPPKMIFHSDGLGSIGRGAHKAVYEEPVPTRTADIAVYHYPLRRAAAFAERIAQIATALEGRDLPAAASWKFRRWAAMVERTGTAETALAEALPNGPKLNEDLRCGVLTRDRTLAARLRKIDERIRSYPGLARPGGSGSPPPL